jgi:hypothetical protein
VLLQALHLEVHRAAIAPGRDHREEGEVRRIPGHVGGLEPERPRARVELDEAGLPGAPAPRALQGLAARGIAQHLGRADRGEAVVLIDAPEHRVEPKRRDRRDLDGLEGDRALERGPLDLVDHPRVRRGRPHHHAPLELREQLRRRAAAAALAGHVHHQGLEIGGGEPFRQRSQGIPRGELGGDAGDELVLRIVHGSPSRAGRGEPARSSGQSRSAPAP